MRLSGEVMNSQSTAQGSGSRESRKTPRRIFVHPMGVLSAGNYGLVRSLQLSEGGLLFETPDPFQIHDGIVVSFLLPDGHGVVARGEVIYSKPGRGGRIEYGVKFAALSLKLRRMIRLYVTAKTQAEAEAEDETMRRLGLKPA
jgi:hypothetical protein